MCIAIVCLKISFLFDHPRACQSASLSWSLMCNARIQSARRFHRLAQIHLQRKPIEFHSVLFQPTHAHTQTTHQHSFIWKLLNHSATTTRISESSWSPKTQSRTQLHHQENDKRFYLAAAIGKSAAALLCAPIHFFFSRIYLWVLPLYIMYNNNIYRESNMRICSAFDSGI